MKPTLARRFLAGESGWCLRANRLGALHGSRLYFAAISRLGDGVFWYGLMAVLLIADGRSGLAASAHPARRRGPRAALVRRLTWRQVAAPHRPIGRRCDSIQTSRSALRCAWRGEH